MVTDIVATHDTKRSKAGEPVLLDISGHEVPCLKSSFYARNQGCKLECKRLTGKVDEGEISGDDDVPDTASLQLLLQLDAG